MKRNITTFLIIFLLLLNQHVSAQGSSNPGDTLTRYYSRLANSKNVADQALLGTQLYQLLKSKEEKDWLTAQRFFYQLKKQKTADSILAACRVSYPLGQIVRGDETKAIYDEKDPGKKEAMYKAWIKKFPPEKFGTDRIQYDYVRNSVASAYAEADNVKKAVQYANMTETDVWKGEGWAGPATKLLKNGHLKEASDLFTKARNLAYKYMTTNRNEAGAGFAATGFIGYSNSLAEILYNQKKYSEALEYIKVAHDSARSVRANINANYAAILQALGKEREAFEIINEAVAAGQANADMKNQLKTLYAKVKGSNEGYDAYMTSLNKILAESIRKEMAKKIISQPAAMFTLQDVDGKTVSLADYKGKVVILDFWATWCGPCKRSFPAMNMAVSKYKDDPNVKFLFIHTWEKEEEATKKARDYVKENNYSFEVLMDLKDPITGLNKVVDSYKVSGIPAKFVVDKNGNIRFALTGFSGGDDAAVEELSAMIEMAQVK